MYLLLHKMTRIEKFESLRKYDRLQLHPIIIVSFSVVLKSNNPN